MVKLLILQGRVNGSARAPTGGQTAVIGRLLYEEEEKGEEGVVLHKWKVMWIPWLGRVIFETKGNDW